MLLMPVISPDTKKFNTHSSDKEGRKLTKSLGDQANDLSGHLCMIKLTTTH